MKYPKVLLTAAQRKIIEKAVIEESASLNQKIHAIAVGKSHIHLERIVILFWLLLQRVITKMQQGWP
jgi:hypothetical protein